MTKLLITIFVIGLIGAATPQIYYNSKTVVAPITASAIQVSSESTVHKPAPKTTKKKTVSTKIVIPTVTPEAKVYIEEIFGEDSKVATATFMHESGLVLDKKGYNCHYYNKEGKRYSTSCKTKEDRANAWSVDCGYAQINVRGKECPASLLTLEGNMEVAKKKYEEQGLKAWASYNNGSYKKFLDSPI